MDIRRLQLESSWGALKLCGGSRAGEGTLILLPQLRLALDPGRPHRALTPMSTVFLSHGHADHLGGLAYWASQRYLNSLGRSTLLVPAELAAEIRELLALHASLEGGAPYKVEVVAVGNDARRHLRADLELYFFATDHWVPTLGTTVSWHKKRLKDELAGLPGEEIARRRAAGEEVHTTETIPVLSYCADSGPQLFKLHPELLQSEILVVECSFFAAGDEERARRYGHTHLQDLLALAPRLQCRHLVLIHASRRHRLHQVEKTMEQELAPTLTCQLHHLNVDWD